MKWFVAGKPNSSVRIVRDTNPVNFNFYRRKGGLKGCLANANGLLRRINANKDRNSAGFDLISTNGDAHAQR